MSAPFAAKGPARPAHLRTKSSSRPYRSNDGNRTRHISEKPQRSAKLSEIERDDIATANFVRRVLCADHLKPAADLNTSQSLDGVLPPLTSSNEIDIQLYGIIAVIIKSFVQVWYSKITPDHEFVDEIVQIIAHCTRGIEQRLRRVDIQALLLDEVPELLIQHVDAYRVASAASTSTRRASQAIGADTRMIYHSINPHPALEPVPVGPGAETESAQQACEIAWRQLLVEGVLEHLLPPEDLANPCLKVLVGEIFSELIIGNVLGGKVSEGWFLWEGITKAIQAVRTAKDTDVTKSANRKPARLEKFGLLATDETTNKLSGHPSGQTQRLYLTIQRMLTDVLRILALMYGLVRLALVAVSDAVFLPPRKIGHGTTTSSPTESPAPDASDAKAKSEDNNVQGAQIVAVMEMSAWSLPWTVLGLSISMPWLTGICSLCKHYCLYGTGTIAAADTRLDRLLSHQLSTRLLSPTQLPSLLRAVRQTLFPNNAPGPARPVPATADEVAAVRRACAEELLDLVPAYLRSLYLGGTAGGGGGGGGSSSGSDREAQVRRVEAEVLCVWEDGYCNKHVLFAIVETVVCRLFPEMAAGGGGGKR